MPTDAEELAGGKMGKVHSRPEGREDHQELNEGQAAKEREEGRRAVS